MRCCGPSPWPSLNPESIPFPLFHTPFPPCIHYSFVILFPLSLVSRLPFSFLFSPLSPLPPFSSPFPFPYKILCSTYFPAFHEGSRFLGHYLNIFCFHIISTLPGPFLSHILSLILPYYVVLYRLSSLPFFLRLLSHIHLLFYVVFTSACDPFFYRCTYYFPPHQCPPFMIHSSFFPLSSDLTSASVSFLSCITVGHNISTPNTGIRRFRMSGKCMTVLLQR